MEFQDKTIVEPEASTDIEDLTVLLQSSTPDIPRSYIKSGEVDRRESRLLKIGYFYLMTQMYLFRKDITLDLDCISDIGNTLFNMLEREYTPVPTYLTFDSVKDNIHPFHHERIEKMWKKHEWADNRLAKVVATIKRKWEKAPSADEEAVMLVVQSPINLQQEYRRAIEAIISDTVDEVVDDWQEEERSLRESLYYRDKIFFASLKMYYISLLEESEEDSKNPPVFLEENNQLKSEISTRLEYLHFIDLIHQLITISKAAHHEQRGNKLRTTEPVPYLYHPWGVLMILLRNFSPDIKENERLLGSLRVAACAAMLHDVPEDTDLNEEETVEFLLSKLENIDSRLAQTFWSGFGKSRKQLKESKFNILNSEEIENLKTVLRVLNKKTVMTEKEIKTAFSQNIAGTRYLMDLLGMEKEHMVVFDDLTVAKSSSAKSETFTMFQDMEEKSLDMFLISLNVIGSPQEKWETILIKLADREHNLRTLAGKKPKAQRKTLRGTVTRLIPWAKFDYNQPEYPISDLIPPFIQVTMDQYLGFFKEDRECVSKDESAFVEEADKKYIRKLIEWGAKIPDDYLHLLKEITPIAGS